MRLEISDQAKLDLRLIGDWIAQENPARAISFVDELLLECLSLNSFPHRYPEYRISETSTLRRKSYGNYLIFYAVLEEVVVVARILHGAQDYADLF
jgi:toxin ParE1/3/4